jgi:hypothetical protein
MFGEARSLIAASDGELVMSEELGDLLFEAHGLDPRRYAEEWIPYLTSLDCWSGQSYAFADLESFARWHEVLPFMTLTFHPYDYVDRVDPMIGFAQDPVIGHITAIDLQDYVCTPEVFAALVSARLDALRDLTCGWNVGSDDEVAALAGAPWAPGLRALRSWNTRPSFSGLEALFTSGRFGALEELSYGGDLSARAVVASGKAAFPALRKLTLSQTRMSLDVLLALLSAGVFEGVRELDLSGNLFDERGVRRLASSPSLRAVETLDVRGVHLGDHTVDILERRIPRNLPNLSTLCVRPGQVDEQALGRAPALRSKLGFVS